MKPIILAAFISAAFAIAASNGPATVAAGDIAAAEARVLAAM